jgi:hypothetical protein
MKLILFIESTTEFTGVSEYSMNTRAFFSKPFAQ